MSSGRSAQGSGQIKAGSRTSPGKADERRIRQLLEDQLSVGQGLTTSQIREILSTSCKYAAPIGEYLNRIGFTRREGDVSILAERATA